MLFMLCCESARGPHQERERERGDHIFISHAVLEVGGGANPLEGWRQRAASAPAGPPGPPLRPRRAPLPKSQLTLSLLCHRDNEKQNFAR